MSLQARQELCKKLVFQDEHNGTAHPTQRADILNPDKTSTNLIALLIDVVKYAAIEITAVRSDHHDDGPHGHAGGFAADGWYIVGLPGTFLDDVSVGCAKAVQSPWCRQLGLAGEAWSDAPQALRDNAKVFEDSGADHLHFGAVV